MLRSDEECEENKEGEATVWLDASAIT